VQLLETEALPAGADPGEGGAPDADNVRFLVRVPRSAGTTLATALRAGQAGRSTRKEPGAFAWSSIRRS
jgi:hypothetical protein